MKLFEACFNVGNFDTYERFYNTETNKSEIQKVFLKNQVFIDKNYLKENKNNMMYKINKDKKNYVLELSSA